VDAWANFFLGVLALQVTLQRVHARDVAAGHRGTTQRTIALGRGANAVVALAGLALVWRNDATGAYAPAAGSCCCSSLPASTPGCC
jgi:hypothetical protein